MAEESIPRIVNNVRTVIVGKPELVELAMVAVLCEGHILIEDVPGTGKTTLARAIAISLGCSFQRIQCTPDLLPSDITGIYFYNQKKCEFEFRAGPVMSNVVLVDEINRATPRTQSSLLECMEERQITVDGVTMPTPRPFLIIATQNPVELQGTFPLPEAQLDRFLLRMRLGYPDRAEEDTMLLRFERTNPLDTLTAVTSASEILGLKRLAQEVHVEKSVRFYILDFMRTLRFNQSILLGPSPRASLALYRAAQAFALIKGRDYVIPDDIKALAVPVLAHRLVMSTDSYLHDQIRERIIEETITSIKVPVEE